MNNEGESATSAGSRSDFLARFFRLQVARPWWVIGLCVLGCLSAAWFLPQLKTDLGPDAFLAPDNPALVYRDIVKEQFGLSDPLVLAVVDRRPGGIYRPQVLQLLQWLTDQISQLPNVPASRVVRTSAAPREPTTPPKKTSSVAPKGWRSGLSWKSCPRRWRRRSG